MNTVTFLVLATMVVFVVWVTFSPDKLANTLRARFKGVKARAADALDDAIDRMEAAEADVEAQLAKANTALIEVKTMRKLVEDQIAVKRSGLLKWQTAAENAASVQKFELVKEALVRKHDEEVGLAELEKQFKFLLGKEAEVQKAVSALDNRKAILKRQKIEIKTRAKTAETTLSVNELLAGIDLDGQVKDVERAYELVREVEARSGAMGEIVDTITSKQKIEEELERLSQPQFDISTEAVALMEKYKDKNSVQS